MVHFVRLLGQWPNLHLMDKISDIRATRMKRGTDQCSPYGAKRNAGMDSRFDPAFRFAPYGLRWCFLENQLVTASTDVLR